MKTLTFLGNSLEKVRAFPSAAKQDAGRQLALVQKGLRPNDCKSMPTIGKGVEEIRVWDESGTYRVIYTARLKDSVFVLHAFHKKTQATAKSDIELAQSRFKQLMRGEI